MYNSIIVIVSITVFLCAFIGRKADPYFWHQVLGVFRYVGEFFLLAIVFAMYLGILSVMLGLSGWFLGLTGTILVLVPAFILACTNYDRISRRINLHYMNNDMAVKFSRKYAYGNGSEMDESSFRAYMALAKEALKYNGAKRWYHFL